MGQWDKICSIISRVCAAKVHALFSKHNCSFVRLFAIMFALTQRAQSSHRELCFPQNCIRPADNEFLSRRTNGRRFRGSQMAEMAEIFPLFRYFSVSSVIDKDNSHGDWREDIFYNGRNGNDRAVRAEPSWLEFCRVVKEEDESQIIGK